MSNVTAVGIAAREACEKFPDVETRTLARMLAKDRPKLFPTIDKARCAIRYVRGNCGAKCRVRATDKSQFRPPGKAGQVTMPEPVVETWEPLRIEGPARVGVLSDIHVPYHDRTALETAVKECKRHRCDTIIINGDLIDFCGISRFEKDPEVRQPAEEIRNTAQLMLWLRQQFPKARLIYKEGNHCARWSVFIWKNAPVLWQLQQVRLPNVLGWEMADATGNESVKLEKYGWEHVHDKRMILCGKLPMLHGHEARISGGINPARAAYLKTSHTVLIGHLHKTSQHTESGIFFDECATFSTGCLCSLRPSYMPYGHRWNHGFAIIDVQNNQEFDVRNHRIADGKVRAS